MTLNASPPESVNLLGQVLSRFEQSAHASGPFPTPHQLAMTESTTLASSGDDPGLNVLGSALDPCSCQPMTGWYRDGSCRTGPADLGRHTVCCVINEAFLSYSRAQGNDLSTPMPQFGFPGLNPGDHWCVCAPRWLEAYEDGMAPSVKLEATEQSTLEVIPLEVLRQHAA